MRGLFVLYGIQKCIFEYVFVHSHYLIKLHRVFRTKTSFLLLLARVLQSIERSQNNNPQQRRQPCKTHSHSSDSSAHSSSPSTKLNPKHKGETNDHRISRNNRRLPRHRQQILTPNKLQQRRPTMIPLPLIISGVTTIYNIIEYINSDK